MKKNNNSIFITGTDTSVGKTFNAALLLGFLRENNIDAGYQKWISSGGHECEDLHFCLENNGLEVNPDLEDLQAVYRLGYPASPHLAAEMEGIKIDPELILARWQEYSRRKELLVVEGVGGLLVPLQRNLLLADLLDRIKLPTLLVARSGLGTLNHTLLSLEALRSRDIPLLGVIFSDAENDAEFDELLLSDNQRTIAEIGRVKVFGRVKRCVDFTEAREEFWPVGQSILQTLKQKKSLGLQNQ